MSNFNDLIEIAACNNPSRQGDVIFVHGLGGTARGTWHPQEKQDDDNFWCAWLGEDLSDVGIWSLGYEVEPFRWKGNSMPLSDRATNSLDLLDSYEIGDRPIIFITHSMGGLLVKQMLRNARDFGKWSAIASQTRGIVFLSTPHSGSDMASWIKHIGGILQTTVSVEELEVHHSRLRELNLLYRNDDQFSQIPMLVYCETRPTKGILVVNQTSADPGIKGVIPVPMDFDHISICKVADRKSQIYRQVKRFIKQNLATHSVASRLNNLAKLHSSQGRYAEAEPLYVQALESRKRLLGYPNGTIYERGNFLSENHRMQILTPQKKTFKFKTITVNYLGNEIKPDWDKAEFFEEVLEPKTTLEMVHIIGGDFHMGSPNNEKGRVPNKEQQQLVNVSSFYIAKTPITQAQWKSIAALPKVDFDIKDEPSRFEGDDLPVENISWYQAVEFCKRLSRKTGRDYRLPREIEWEYACRANTTTPFHFGETVTTNLANYNGTQKCKGHLIGDFRGRTTPVENFKVANAFGLYDMHGNVWEWCSSDFKSNTGEERKEVLRGGSWKSNAYECRAASRCIRLASGGSDNYGFRVALSNY